MEQEEIKPELSRLDFSEDKTYIFLDIQDKTERDKNYKLLLEEAIRRGEEEVFKSKAEEINRKFNPYSAPYLVPNKHGKLVVNTSLLAEYIRNNSYYYIVKKQGSETFFIYWYEEGYYKHMSAGEVKAKIKEYIPLEIRRPTVWEDTYKDLVSTNNFISYDQLNTYEHLINFKNGISDTQTWQLIKHSPQYNHTYQIQYNYNEKAEEPKIWEQFVATLVSGDTDSAYSLQEWMGLNISNYNANLCKKSVALCGAVGNTGKSKLLKMLAQIIGIHNICSKSIQDLAARFGAGALYGKKCVLIDDQKATNIEGGSTFKAITGDGIIEVELKGKDPFSFAFKGGITFTCNEMPYIKDDKGSHMFERFFIIPCNNVIPKEKRDNRLFEKMEKEIEGIILWALKGLKRLMNNSFVLTESERSKEANKQYRVSNDSLFRFINEYCIITGDKRDKIAKPEFEERYTSFCIANGINGLDKKNIADRAEKNGVICNKYNGYYHYRGIRYKNGF